MRRINRRKIIGGNDFWGAPAIPMIGRAMPTYKGSWPVRGKMAPFGISGSSRPFLGSAYPPILPNRSKKQIGRNIFGIAYPKPSLIGKRTKLKGLPIFSVANPIKLKQLKVSNPFMLNTGNRGMKIKRKDLRWPQAMSNPKYRKLNPFGDADKDGVLNMFDCRPFDPRRQEDLPKGEAAKRIGAKIISPEEFEGRKKKIKDTDYRGLTAAESKAQGKEIARLRGLTVATNRMTSEYQERQDRKADEIDAESARFEARLLAREAKEAAEAEKLKEKEAIKKEKKRLKRDELRMTTASQKEYERTIRAKGKTGLEKKKEERRMLGIMAREGRDIRKYQSAKERREADIRKKQLALESKFPKQFGTIESLGKTRDILAGRRIEYQKDIEKNIQKISKSREDRKIRNELLSAAAKEKDPTKKAALLSSAKNIKTLTTGEERRLQTDIEYKKMKEEKTSEGRRVLGDIEERKKKTAMTIEKMGLGWVAPAARVTKERLKAGFQRYKHEKQGKVFTKRATGLLGALTSTGGAFGVEGNIFSGGPDKRAIEVNPFEAEAIKQEQYDKAYAADQAKKAGRPFGSFKYGMPIHEYKAMQAQLRRQQAIQEAMAQAAKASELQAQTDKMLAGGSAYPSQTSMQATDYSQYTPSIQQQAPISQPMAQTSQYPGQLTSEPTAALGGIPQYDLTKGGPMNLAQANRQIVEREWNGWDIPTRSTANKSMTTTQLKAIPNIYGDANPDPRYARIPTLPVDPAMIREDDLPREYYADEAQAEAMRERSEQTYTPDIAIRGQNPSLQGDVPIQYAVKKRDLRAPTVKSMVLQTQNDGQRKMVPVLKANPWGLQLKNRINFSENNILESDLKGNVVSRDAIGGQILQAPNVFKNNATFNYNPMKNPQPLSGGVGAMPSATGLSSQISMNQAEQIKRQMAMQIAQQQTQEEKQPSFFQKLASGIPLRSSRPTQQVTNRKPTIFDKLKNVVSGTARAEERAQQSFVEEQQYIEQPTQSRIDPAGVMTQQDMQGPDEVEINMTEEEFNSLPVEDQQKVIEASQKSQVMQQQQQMTEEEIADLQALREEQSQQDVPDIPQQQYVGSAAPYVATRGINMGKGGTRYG
jgi:hypothetical protein